MISTDSDLFFMQCAYALAEEAFELGEVPVGAVLVYKDEIISSACNSNRQDRILTRHAEIKVIEDACRYFQNERLSDCELFVTKEPCAMCAGAIIHSRVRRLIIGTEDVKYGSCGTVFNICGNTTFNHVPEIVFGVLRADCRELIQKFFRNLRTKI